MLKSLRNKKIMQFIMWGLVAVFVLWGVGSVAVSRRVYEGTIFGKKISMQEYSKSYSAVLNRAKMVYGDNLSKFEKFLNLKDQAWDRLILLYEARRRHITASNREVVEKIASIETFQRNGVFNEGIYNYIIENAFGIPAREFEESVRGDIIINKLSGYVTKDIKVTDDEIRKAYAAENELADVSFILIKPQGYAKDVVVKNEELPVFYKEHINNFKSPMMVDVAYLRMPFGDKKEDAAFLAEEVMAYIKKGAALKGAAKEYNLALKETGFFSLNSKIPEIGLSYPFALSAFALEKDQISDIVETADSYCIMQLKSKQLPQIMPFQDVKDKVREFYINERAGLLAEAAAKEMASLIQAGNESFDGIVKKQGYDLLNAKGINRKSYIQDIGPSEIFTEAAFSLKAGEVGGPVKTQKGFALIRLDSLKPIDEYKFKEDKDTFSKELLDRKKMEQFQQWFLELKKNAKLKESLPKL